MMWLIPLIVHCAIAPSPLAHALEAARAHRNTRNVSTAELVSEGASVDLPATAKVGDLDAPELRPARGVDRQVVEDEDGDDEILFATAHAYYEVVAAQGVSEAAVRALSTANDCLEVTVARRVLGAANQLAVVSATADVAHARETLAAAARLLGSARRRLAGFTGEEPPAELPALLETNVPPESEDFLVDEAQRLQTGDAIRAEVHTSWLAVEGEKARALAAEAEASRASEAMGRVQREFHDGVATWLDVSRAQRDAFNADANLALSRSSLAVAVLALHRAAGEKLLPDR